MGIQSFDNCPSCILSLEMGLELMRESCEPMEFRIFDFYKVFSRAFGEGGNEACQTQAMQYLNLSRCWMLRNSASLFSISTKGQCAYSVDITLNELAGLLNSEKTSTKGILTSYVNKVKDLKKGIDKCEELLERDMQLSRTKCQRLQEQVIQLLDKASVSEIVLDVTVPV